MSVLFPKLNEYHNTDFSEKYWRIIIGPWLYPTIALLFDRWSMIDKALSEFPVDCVEIAEHDLKELIQIDFISVNEKGIKYNEAIYAEILKYRGGLKLQSVETFDKAKTSPSKQPLPLLK